MIFLELVKKCNLSEEICLAIDESGFSKKGKGVKQQYNGNVGKLDNCQVGVFAALNAGGITSLVHADLLDSEEGISKIELAKNMIEHVVDKLEIKPKCINFDAFYGRDTGLLAYVDKKGLKFIGDVPQTHHVYLENFQMRLPKAKGNRGRKPSIRKPNKESISIKNYCSQLQKKDFKEVNIRNGSTGKIKAKIHTRIVYVLNPNTNTVY